MVAVAPLFEVEIDEPGTSYDLGRGRETRRSRENCNLFAGIEIQRASGIGPDSYHNCLHAVKLPT
jgi:hypothetical protein